MMIIFQYFWKMTLAFITRNNLHLIISVFVLIPIALVYGFKPDLLFEVVINSKDDANIFKAIMGLYLGFSILWIYGIARNSLWKTATLSNMAFMLGLGSGRVVALIFDGMPSWLFVIGTIGEFGLGFYGLYRLQHQKSSD